MKKNKKAICRNCRLFMPEKSLCGIVVIHEGRHTHLPVDAEDKCFFEEMYYDPIEKSETAFNEEVKELRMWENNGKVRFEQPED